MTPERWRQLEELYDAVRDLSPSARAVRLSQADPELGSAVEAIFAQEGSLLDHAAWEGRESLLNTAEPVQAGAQLGPYRIERRIGKGGMGEVYLAHDSRLRRDVAIKILPNDTVADPQRTQRFLQEARAASALNHPNIVTLYDIANIEGATYLVMEYVPGKSLDKLIKPKGLPLAEVLNYTQQIAGGLAAAHAAGIVHRDMKPGNVIVTPESRVKILDFGLAKLMERAPGADGETQTPDAPLTEAGTIMGTIAYMSPEQASAKTVDHRTDIFSLGVMLYEMLAGTRPFRGASRVETMHAILHDPAPPLESVPPRLEEILEKALEKDPKDRYQHAGDLALDLRRVERNPGTKSAQVPAVPPTKWRAWIPWAAALIVAGVAAWAPWRHDPAKQIGEPLVRIDADLGTGVSLFTENGPALALSHDGTRVAFSSRTEDGSMRLYWRRLDQAAATALPGTEFAFAPFFSPDGEQIAFFAEGSLKKIELATGNVTVLANAVNPSGGAWGEDGVIIFHRAPSLDLWTVPANGGEMKRVPRPASESQYRHWPQLLPGGKSLLVTGVAGLGGNVDKGSLRIVSLADGHSRTLVDGAHFGRYLSSGHLVYLKHGTMFVRAFDAARQELTGPEVPILQGVEYSSLNGAGQFDVAANGTLIYRAARAGSELKTVQWMDRTGRLEPLLATPGDYRGISLSPDGKRLAIDIVDAGGGDLYVYDVERREPPARLTVGANVILGGGGPRGLAWNPDGRYLFFVAGTATWWVPTDGLSQPREFIKDYRVSMISHDGTRMFASTNTRETRGDAGIVPLSVGRDGPQAGPPVPLLHEPFTESPYDDSPDGRWLSYATDETGIAQEYVTEIANPARKWMMSGSSGTSGFWSQSGREIFFTTFFAPLRIMVVSYSLEGGHFQPGQPRQWSPVAIPIRAGEGPTSVTMAPDGKRFAVLMPAEQPLGNRVTFVMNFFDEVRRRTAPGK